MPDITDSVGEGGANNAHDVALVQAMLKVIKNAKGVAYLRSNYDGVYGGDTKKAIVTFQTDHKLLAAPTPHVKATEKQGLVAKDSLTLKQLTKQLAAPYDAMRVIEGMKTVYIAGDAADANTSRHTIATHDQLETAFRNKVADLVQTMYKTHGIVLWLTKTGSRRTFAEQAAETKTKAGPGESNHNFGRAVDIGFKAMRWVRGNGTIKKDADWLNDLESAKPKQANAFWDARDAIALKKLGMFRLKFERVHLQAFDQSTVSNVKSLAALLTDVGEMKWVPRYKTDLGLGKKFYDVGNAKVIWAGNANVTKAMAAAYLTETTKKAVAEKDIKQTDLKALRVTLKKEFETADANWNKWTAVAS